MFELCLVDLESTEVFLSFLCKLTEGFVDFMRLPREVASRLWFSCKAACSLWRSALTFFWISSTRLVSCAKSTPFKSYLLISNLSLGISIISLVWRSSVYILLSMSAYFSMITWHTLISSFDSALYSAYSFLTACNYLFMSSQSSFFSVLKSFSWSLFFFICTLISWSSSLILSASLWARSKFILATF